MKPKLFIGSSVEGISIAYACQKNLHRYAEVTVWDQGIFKISSTALDSLLETLERSDFGLFIFSPDDIAIIRGSGNSAVRDNVIFELGLFIGRVGKSRCFFIQPDDCSDLRLPTDLVGIQPGVYEAARSDKNLQAGTATACHEIRDEISRLGPVIRPTNDGRGSESATSTERANISLNAPKISPLESNAEAAKATSDITIREPKVTELQSDENEEKVTPEKRWMQHFIDKNYREAIAAIEEMFANAKSDSGRASIESLKVAISYYAGNEDWERNFREVINRYPGEYAPVADLARLYSNANIPLRALEILNEGISTFGPIEALIVLKAQVLEKMDNGAQALSLLLEAIETKPQCENFYITLANLYTKLGQEENGLKICASGLASLPTSKPVLSRFAELLAKRGENEAALYIYNRLLLLDSDNSDAIALAANVALDLDLYDRALSQYEQANTLAKEKEGWIIANIGNIMNARGFYTKAIESLRAALVLDADSDYAHERLGDALKSRKASEERFDALIKKGARYVAQLNN